MNKAANGYIQYFILWIFVNINRVLPNLSPPLCFCIFSISNHSNISFTLSLWSHIFSSTSHSIYFMHGVFFTVVLFSHSLFITSGVQLVGIVAAPTRNYVINYLRRDYVIKLLCVCVFVHVHVNTSVSVYTWMCDCVLYLVATLLDSNESGEPACMSNLFVKLLTYWCSTDAKQTKTRTTKKSNQQTVSPLNLSMLEIDNK